MKIVKIFRLKIVIFTALKNRCMLHGRVFVMNSFHLAETGYFSLVAWPDDFHVIQIFNPETYRCHNT